jgi:glycosyltransferase involved in cell wall biosynthesis
MDIVFFRHSLLNRGGDKMIVVYANHLAASGHHVTIKTNLVDSVFTLDDRINVVPLRFPGKIGTIISAFLEKSGADLIIADIVAMVCMLSFLNRRKLLCFAQDYDESYYSFSGQKLFIRLLYYLALNLFKVKAIAVSRPLAELLRNRFNADVTVVENGIDTNIFYPSPDKELVSSKEGRKAVLLHSRTDYRKGFDIAVEVIKRVQLQMTVPFEVWTVGVPVQGLFTGCVHRDFGYVGEDDLRRIMSSADIFLYPSRHEGLPLMPLEAMACGCAVVTTTAVPFAVDAENALVTRIADVDAMCDCVYKLLCDERLVDHLVIAGYRLADTYCLENAARSFEDHICK